MDEGAWFCLFSRGAVRDVTHIILEVVDSHRMIIERGLLSVKEDSTVAPAHSLGIQYRHLVWLIAVPERVSLFKGI